MSITHKRRSATPKSSLADDLFPLVPASSWKYWLEVEAGDAEAARNLIFAAQNNQRGKIVAALWKHRVPPVVLRSALEDAYDHDHGHVCNALGRKGLVAAFKTAQFPTDHLPDEFAVWRGISGDPTILLSGMSWTRDRDCACWFAMRFAEIYPPPRVIKATVKREQVLAHLTGRVEDEIVVAPFSIIGETDGDVEDWQEAARRVNQRGSAESPELAK